VSRLIPPFAVGLGAVLIALYGRRKKLETGAEEGER
jgi:hypothetical protein